MPSYPTARYPEHLTRLVSARLRSQNLAAPPDRLLLRLFECLYFASLKTDEGRPCLCTVNFVDPRDEGTMRGPARQACSWTTIPFGQPLPCDVRTLTKLAEAADPTVSSLAVFGDDRDSLSIWGMVDQELRYSDYVSLDSSGAPQRPGLFQATINGVGNLCVYKDYTLLGSLEQNTLVERYHDVLWAGPVHDLLRRNLTSILSEHPAAAERVDRTEIEHELFVRWQNAICRVLLNIQQYRHGGGLLILPQFPADDLNVKHHLTYDRLPQALLGLVQHQLLKQQAGDEIARQGESSSEDLLPRQLHRDAVRYQAELELSKNLALGCCRFVASLSRVDGVVLMDRRLVVHGFGAELRADTDLQEVYIAGDPQATPRLLRSAPLSHFGTRHRAMMRFCDKHEGALGFVVSQDGGIRAIMRVQQRLILWENINVQLAFRAENHGAPLGNLVPMMSLFEFWGHGIGQLGS